LVDNLITDIDTPGSFELTAYSDGVANALTLAQNAAQSGRGFLYEAPERIEIFYDSYDSRATQIPLTLTEDDLLAVGLRQAAQWSEIVNDVTLSLTRITKR
jgi:hypothetical protein